MKGDKIDVGRPTIDFGKKAMTKAMKKAMKMRPVAHNIDTTLKLPSSYTSLKARNFQGERARASSLVGCKEKISSCLSKANSAVTVVNRDGKIVSKEASDAGKRYYYEGNMKAQSWNKAFLKARKDLNIKGFVPVGGKTAVGKALLARTRAIYNS